MQRDYREERWKSEDGEERESIVLANQINCNIIINMTLLYIIIILIKHFQ